MEANLEMHSACERGGRIFIKLFFLCSGILLAEFIKECPKNWNLCDITIVLFRANLSPILIEHHRMNSTNNLCISSELFCSLSENIMRSSAYTTRNCSISEYGKAVEFLSNFLYSRNVDRCSLEYVMFVTWQPTKLDKLQPIGRRLCIDRSPVPEIEILPARLGHRHTEVHLP